MARVEKQSNKSWYYWFKAFKQACFSLYPPAKECKKTNKRKKHKNWCWNLIRLSPQSTHTHTNWGSHPWWLATTIPFLYTFFAAFMRKYKHAPWGAWRNWYVNVKQNVFFFWIMMRKKKSYSMKSISFLLLLLNINDTPFLLSCSVLRKLIDILIEMISQHGTKNVQSLTIKGLQDWPDYGLKRNVTQIEKEVLNFGFSKKFHQNFIAFYQPLKLILK